MAGIVDRNLILLKFIFSEESSILKDFWSQEHHLQSKRSVKLMMAELGVFGQIQAVRPRDHIQGSPSTGSDDGVDQNFPDDFDPFHGDPDEPDEVDSSSAAPPEER